MRKPLQTLVGMRVLAYYKVQINVCYQSYKNEALQGTWHAPCYARTHARLHKTAGKGLSHNCNNCHNKTPCNWQSR
jgi:hypothetical protein